MLLLNRSWPIGASKDWRFKAIIKLKSGFSGSEQTVTYGEIKYCESCPVCTTSWRKLGYSQPFTDIRGPLPLQNKKFSCHWVKSGLQEVGSDSCCTSVYLFITNNEKK
jgi:hypothetical protein